MQIYNNCEVLFQERKKNPLFRELKRRFGAEVILNVEQVLWLKF